MTRISLIADHQRTAQARFLGISFPELLIHLGFTRSVGGLMIESASFECAEFVRADPMAGLL